MTNYPKDLAERLQHQLDYVIQLLESLPPSEAAIGWDRPRIENWLKVFRDLGSSLLAGNHIKYACYVRGLDMSGITAGKIFDATLGIDETTSEMEDWLAN